MFKPNQYENMNVSSIANTNTINNHLFLFSDFSISKKPINGKSGVNDNNVDIVIGNTHPNKNRLSTKGPIIKISKSFFLPLSLNSLKKPTQKKKYNNKEICPAKV